MRYLLTIYLCITLHGLQAQPAMQLWPDTVKTRWGYELGVVLNGMEAQWDRTHDTAYVVYIRHMIDPYIGEDGSIRTYQEEDFNLDNINTGRSLLLLYRMTGLPKYHLAAAHLRDQLTHQPRNAEGGFWHKKIYPDQMWLDGLYMAEPFYARYDSSAFDDIAHQFVLMEQHTRDPATGLLRHGWDASKREAWANPQTGCSAHCWARAMGWYGAALVDVLEIRRRKDLQDLLARWAAAVAQAQDTSGLWWDVMDEPGKANNYFESSAACLFVYALAKGARLGLLPERYRAIAEKGYAAINRRFVKNGNLTGTVSVSGLGGHPYRDGSDTYYFSERVVTNDPKGVGAYLLASAWIEMN